MAKQKTTPRKVPNDGYIAPKDPANVAQNPGPPPPMYGPPAGSDLQVIPAPAAPLRPVVSPPAPGPESPPPPLVQ
jgi:hypothetical protein